MNRYYSEKKKERKIYINLILYLKNNQKSEINSPADSEPQCKPELFNCSVSDPKDEAGSVLPLKRRS